MRSLMFCLPIFEESVASGEQGCIALMSMVKSPANFGECQRVGVDEVAILPTGLKFLLEGEEGVLLARIAKTVGQEGNTGPQKGLVCVIDLTLGRKTETHDVSSFPVEGLDGPF